jgi:hypothetical protein
MLLSSAWQVSFSYSVRLFSFSYSARLVSFSYSAWLLSFSYSARLAGFSFSVLPPSFLYFLYGPQIKQGRQSFHLSISGQRSHTFSLQVLWMAGHFFDLCMAGQLVVCFFIKRPVEISGILHNIKHTGNSWTFSCANRRHLLWNSAEFGGKICAQSSVTAARSLVFVCFHGLHEYATFAVQSSVHGFGSRIIWKYLLDNSSDEALWK